MTESILTREYVRSLLNYDLNTGIFTWAKRKGRRNRIGNVAGGIGVGGYMMVTIDGKPYMQHRIAFMYVLGYFPACTDHINHDRTDNRWINLRPATPALNMKNMSLYSTNKSGFHGVRWESDRNKWRASIKLNGVIKNLGRFSTKAEAVEARMAANIKHGFHENHGK